MFFVPIIKLKRMIKGWQNNLLTLWWQLKGYRLYGFLLETFAPWACVEGSDFNLSDRHICWCCVL